MFNTEELSHSQALLLPSYCIVSVYCYHLPSPSQQAFQHQDSHLSEVWKSSHSPAPAKCDLQYSPSKVLSPAMWFFSSWSIRKVRKQLCYSGVLSRSALHAICQENFLGCYYGLAFKVRLACLSWAPGKVKEKIILATISKDINNNCWESDEWE